MQTRQPKLQSIQALRGIAALLVLIFHIGAMLGIESGWRQSHGFGKFWTQGYAGVDMFFVISGFIMVYVTAGLTPSLKTTGRFLSARITRIYPLWWVLALVMMAYFMITYGQPAPPDRVSGDNVGMYIFKSLFLWPQEVTPVLGLGWTLIHEMLFYILFALGLLFSRRYLPVWLALWGLLIISVSLVDMPPNHAGTPWQLFTSPLNMDFILGAFAAVLFQRGPSAFSSKIAWIGALLFLAALLIGVTGKVGVFQWKRVIFFGVPSAALILGLAWLEHAGRIKIPTFLARLGDWSYSLYLVHFLVLLAIIRIWNGLEPYLPEGLHYGAPGILDNIIYICFALILSIIAAGISYRLIEKPSLKLLRR